MDTAILSQLVLDGESDETGAIGPILADYLDEHGHDDLAARLRTPGPLPQSRVFNAHSALARRGVLPGGGGENHLRALWFRYLAAGQDRLAPGWVPVCRAGLRPGARASRLRRVYCWLDVSCYRTRPTPRAVRVAFPLIAPALYRPVNDQTAELLGRWLPRHFPHYPRVVIGEPDDRSVLRDADWIVVGEPC
jgi:hypothetical protein